MSRNDCVALNAKPVVNYKHTPQRERWMWQGGGRTAHRGKTFQLWERTYLNGKPFLLFAIFLHLQFL